MRQTTHGHGVGRTRGHGARAAAALLVTAWASSGCSIASGLVRLGHPALLEDVGREQIRKRAPEVLVWDSAAPDDGPDARALRARIAEAAAANVGGAAVVVDGERFRMDCSGVARGIYAQAGLRLGSVAAGEHANDTRVLFELMRQQGSLRRAGPLPGDLVFFDDTWDQNGNGLRDDPLSHVAVVERVRDDGTTVLVHRVGDRIVRAFMNLGQPHARNDARGRPLNHYLRSAGGGEPARTTAELFVAFGSLKLRDAPRLALR